MTKRTITTIILICTVVQLVSAQNNRAYYEAEFAEKKKPFDAVTNTQLEAVGNTIGYTFNTPYLGVFSEDMTLSECDNTNFDSRTFSKGDTFSINKVTHGTFNFHLGVKDTSIYYYATKRDVVDNLLDKEAFLAHYQQLRQQKIDDILPLWGIIACSKIDDYSPTYKTEKYWITSDKYRFYFNLERMGEATSLTFKLDHPFNNPDYKLTDKGCLVPDESYLLITYEDGSHLKKMYEGQEKDCISIKADVSADKEILQKRITNIELSLSKGKINQEIEDNIQGDVLRMKCDCIE